MKDTYPLQTAEYAKANKIQDEPAFAWWVAHAQRIGQRIVAKVARYAKTAKYWSHTHKYGIEVPSLLKKLWKLMHLQGLTSGAKQLTRKWPTIELRSSSLMTMRQSPLVTARCEVTL
jgi:hypothetical protein